MFIIFFVSFVGSGLSRAANIDIFARGGVPLGECECLFVCVGGWGGGVCMWRGLGVLGLALGRNECW